MQPSQVDSLSGVNPARVFNLGIQVFQFSKRHVMRCRNRRKIVTSNNTISRSSVRTSVLTGKLYPVSDTDDVRVVNPVIQVKDSVKGQTILQRNSRERISSSHCVIGGSPCR